MFLYPGKYNELFEIHFFLLLAILIYGLLYFSHLRALPTNIKVAERVEVTQLFDHHSLYKRRYGNFFLISFRSYAANTPHQSLLVGTVK